tara:strand:+ start:108 stop:356 length:249 start_codon:yes stop_codon:yes gene_type:complete
MKRILIPLLASLALPTAVNAETWWLLVKHGEGSKGRSYAWKVPMLSKEDCDEEKVRVVKREEWHAWKNISYQTISAICIKGK